MNTAQAAAPMPSPNRLNAFVISVLPESRPRFVGRAFCFYWTADE